MLNGQQHKKKIVLRDYQIAAINSQWRYWRDGEGRKPVVIAPTGAGKSILIATTIRELRRKAASRRVMMVAHRKELIQQNYAELIELAPELLLDVGIVCAGLGFRYPRDTEALAKPVVAGTIQTLFKHRRNAGKFDLLIVDEAHLVPKKSDATYNKLISDLESVNPEMKMVGYTATPWRLDSGSLIEGTSAIFDGVAYEIGLDVLIDGGHLVPPTTKKITYGMDMDRLRENSYGEFTVASQDDALDCRARELANNLMLSVATEKRKKILVFLPSINSCETVAKFLKSAGREVETVHNDMTAAERDAAIQSFKSGAAEYCCNVEILTTGSNIPSIDCVALMRATTSSVLVVQMVGRGLRTHPGKSDCLILDYGGNFDRHGPIDTIVAPHKERSESESTGSDGDAGMSDGWNPPRRDPLLNLDDEHYVGPIRMGDSDWPAAWAVVNVNSRIKKTYQSNRDGIEITYECEDENEKFRKIKRWFFPESDRSWERKLFAREHGLACKSIPVPKTNAQAIAIINTKWKRPGRVIVDIQQRGKWKGFKNVKEAKYYSEPPPLFQGDELQI